MKMLDILGMDNWKPTACSYCNKLSMATDKSLILWFIIFFNLKDAVGNIEIPLETSFKLVKRKTNKSIQPTANALVD